MGIVVARQFERIFLVPGGDQGELGVLFQWPHDIAQLTVNFRRKRSLRKARTNVGGYLCGGSAHGHFARAAVGKGDFNHLGHGLGSFSKFVKVVAKEGLKFSDHRIGFDLVFWGFKSTKSEGIPNSAAKRPMHYVRCP